MKFKLSLWSKDSLLRLNPLRRLSAVCLFMLLLSASISGQNLSAITGKTYFLPTKPNTKAWATFQSHDEKIAACSVPKEALAQMSTQDLIASIFDYPLISDYLAYDNISTGFQEMSSQSGLFAELYSRSDAGITLLKIYQKTQPEAFDKSWTLAQQGQYAYNIQTLEMLLAQDAIQLQLKSVERQILAKSVLQNVKIMQQYPNIYGASAQTSQVLLLSKTMSAEKYKPLLQDKNAKDWTNGNIDIISIDAQRAIAIGNRYVGGGFESIAAVVCNYTSSSVTTPKSTSVAAYKSDCEQLSAAQIAAYRQAWRITYPNATILSDATQKYNCHSYAWYSSTTSNVYWIDNPTNYWADCSYASTNIWVGSKVCYKKSDGTPSHSANVQNATTNTMRSKWGPGCLMEHKWNDCPYTNTTLYFYKLNTGCPTMTGLATSNISNTSATLKWDVDAKSCVSVKIEIRLKNAKSWALLTTIASNYTQISITGGLSKNTCYEWRITPIMSNITCIPSSIIGFCTTNSATITNSGVAALARTISGNTNINLVAPDGLGGDDVTLIPNPNNGSFSIALYASKQQEVTLNIVNITGQNVHQQKVKLLKGDNIINQQLQLPQGTYFMQIEIDGKPFAQKISIY
jgi:hypothetical protein